MGIVEHVSDFFGGQLVRCDGTGRKHLGCRRSLFKFQSAHTVVFVQFNSEKDARAAAQVSCRTSCVQVEAGEFFFSQYLSINDIVQTPSVFTNRRMGLYFISSGNILPISSAGRPPTSTTAVPAIVAANRTISVSSVMLGISDAMIVTCIMTKKSRRQVQSTSFSSFILKMVI